MTIVKTGLGAWMQMPMAEYDALCAEVERLRAALEHIKDSTEDMVYVKAVARDALANTKRA